MQKLIGTYLATMLLATAHPGGATAESEHPALQGKPTVSSTWNPPWLQGTLRLDAAHLNDGFFGITSLWRADVEEPGPAWALLDLGRACPVQHVRLYWMPGRRASGEHFPAFRVEAGLDTAGLEEVFREDRTPDRFVNATPYEGKTIDFGGPVTARYVKVVFETTEAANLDEIEVFASAPPFRTPCYEPADTHLRAEKPHDPLFRHHTNDLTAWCADSLTRVFRDDTAHESPALTGPVLLHALRGEAEAFQLAGIGVSPWGIGVSPWK